MDANQIVEIIKALAWPVAVLFLAWILRHEIHAVIGRMESAKLPGGTEVSFGKASIDKIEEHRAVTPAALTKAPGNWQNIGNIYWLGHDIMWTIDVILRNAPGRTILHGLRQSVHHMNELGVADTTPGEQLRRLYNSAPKILESEWNVELRNQYSVDLRKISDGFGSLAESQQSDFKPR